MLLDSFHSAQAIMVECIEFSNDGTMYDNMSEDGCKFNDDFKWKSNEDGSLFFPNELKKFTQRGSHVFETLPNEKLDVVFS